MNVAILSARSGWHTDEICRALADRGHAGHVCPYETLVARLGDSPAAGGGDLKAGEDRGASLFAADAVLARIIPAGSLEQIIYRVDALHWLDDRGLLVMNTPRAIERCVDKFYTTALLHEAGIGTPATVVCERAEAAMEAIRGILDRGSDAIVKPLFGSMGHGMVRVGDPDTAWRVVRPLEQMRAVFYVQEALDHGGRDVRAFVVGSRVLAAIERVAPEGEWRTNVARGGRARPVDLPAAWDAVAVRASQVVGAEYAGVDLLAGAGGQPIVLEVNGIPGWQGLQEATGTDVAAALVDHLEQQVRVRREMDDASVRV